ncbi:thioesterase family protein [Pontixanthobacter gangjinensis]|uniref:Thioesterase family protein n=1 Tax=Pontixanthobacter gangjinensis TaxID=1028742 RepID=A0A6I4SK99_9SPHN|nr:thioesterase family protein [Pontixanthobacter gangjinensis]MXO56143.1 thioesterase family protein [Pontixanthobacter gangjinensis]
MSVSNLIESITAEGGTIILERAENWMQGRTLYGGASALIAYTAAIRAFPDLPPFRAGQVGFIAPVGEQFELRSQIIRQGRNVVQIRSEIICDDKIALTAFWLFGTSREANAVHPAPLPDPAPGRPEESVPVKTHTAPSFLKENYDVHYTAEKPVPGSPILRRWTRLKDPSGIDPVSELILMGDTLPPSAARIMQRRGPISSINWSFNLLDTEPRTRDGWWLAETACDHADQGYSSERLRLWNADGKQMLSGIQAVAIFG